MNSFRCQDGDGSVQLSTLQGFKASTAAGAGTGCSAGRAGS